MKRIVVVPGTSNIKLAQKIAYNLDVNLVSPNITKFANGEIFCEIERNVRGADVFVVQSTSTPANDNLMELLIVIDALKRASAASITAVIPHYGYARQDRKVVPRTPISAKLVADLLTVSGATRVMTMDIHAGQIQGYFDIPVDNLHAAPLLIDYIKTNLFDLKTVFVSPDAGGVERVRYFAKKLKADLAMVDKRRTGKNIAKAMNVVGSVSGKKCIIVDDMIDTAGTLIEAVMALRAEGATEVHACATHPILSDPACKRIRDCTDLTSVILTDTIQITKEVESIEKIKILSNADILSKAIYRTFNNDSVSSLFE